MKNIFAKTFFSSMLLTLAVILVSFLLIYLLLPHMYTGYKNETLKKDLEQVCREGDGKSWDEIWRIAVQKADEKGYMLNLLDAQGQVILSHGMQTMTSYVTQMEQVLDEESPDGSTTQDEQKNGDDRGIRNNGEDQNRTEERDGDNLSIENEEVTEIQEIKVGVLSEEGRLKDRNGMRYTAVFLTSLQPVDEAKVVVLRLLPIVLVISLLLTALCSWLHARRITGPIESISRSVMKMKTLERDAVCNVRSGDEIENLAENINELYGRLMKTIDDLQEEYNEKTALDRERVDFMLTVSHELKTPLTGVRGMLECMQYNVGVYSDHETYLKECVTKIDEMTALITDTLSASRVGFTPAEELSDVDLGKMIRDLTAEYELIALKRGVGFEVSVPEGSIFPTDEKLFRKALSNILSNAVKYSRAGERVRIFSEGSRLVIENKCEPLTAEEAARMFTPFVRGDGNTEPGHGLGLYITDRILKVLGADYSFEPFEEGMRFAVEPAENNG